MRELARDTSRPVTFLCGGSRNHHSFLDVFDAVLVLELDAAKLRRRLAERPDEFGAATEELALVLEIHRSGDGIPTGIGIDATAPLPHVVDAILAAIESPAADAATLPGDQASSIAARAIRSRAAQRAGIDAP